MKLGQADYHYKLIQIYGPIGVGFLLSFHVQPLSYYQFTNYYDYDFFFPMLFFILNTSLESNRLHCKRRQLHIGPALMHRQRPAGEKWAARDTLMF